MQIRRFRVGDEMALADVYASAIRLVACKDYTPEQIDAWAPASFDEEKWIKRMRALDPFVAEEGGVPIGYADLQPSGYIDHFFVAGNVPRRGVGRALMQTLIAQAERLGIAEMTSDVSLTAQPFFARFGFEHVERRFVTLYGVTLENARMRRPVALSR